MNSDATGPVNTLSDFVKLYEQKEYRAVVEKAGALIEKEGVYDERLLNVAGVAAMHLQKYDAALVFWRSALEINCLVPRGCERAF